MAVLALTGCLEESEPDADVTASATPPEAGNAGGDGPGGDDSDTTPSQQAKPIEFRTIDGSGNNVEHPKMNAAAQPFRRYMHGGYPDGVAQMDDINQKSARVVSNNVASQDGPIFNERGASDYVWQWGQFLDHDITMTKAADEPANIRVPRGDRFFDSRETGREVISFDRSVPDPESGTGPRDPREQMNSITGWIDASNVYGSDTGRAQALRMLDGTGRLKTSAGDLLPLNVTGLPNGGNTSPELFLAGDERANEQVGLTALHTLFVREHNRLAAQIAAEQPLSDEEIYQRARRIVAAQIQVITYKEFLPALLGPNALEPYQGYAADADARLMNEFTAALYRFGHSMLSPQLLRIDTSGQEIAGGHLPLRDAFFAPQQVIDHGIEPLLRGLAAQKAQAVDAFIIDDVRNFLFGPPGSGGFDLAALNVQRGRDHGMPTYNEMRESLGLVPAHKFSVLTPNFDLHLRLERVYDQIDDVELWIGALSEEHVPGALVGELVFTMLKQQFEALRDGDRFWYQARFEGEELAELEAVTLADIVRRNTEIGAELPDDVFHVPGS